MKPDVAIVGAGPAGMAAAIRATAAGAQVVILDDSPGAGGQIWRGMEQTQNGRQAREWFHTFAALRSSVLNNCRVISASRAPLKLLAETPAHRVEISPRALILATGARELFLPFPGWTLPGVMGAGGLQAMAKSGLPIAGKRIVVAGSGPLLLAVGAYLKSHGAKVKLIAEQASRMAIARFAVHLITQPAKLAQAAGLQLGLRGVPYLQGCWVEEAFGDRRLQSVRIRRGVKTWTVDCDYAAIAYGLYPNAELALLLGCRMSGSCVAVDELQRASIENVYCAGESTGIGGVDLSLVEGEIAGYAATGETGRAHALFARRKRAQTFAEALNSAFALRPELRNLPRGDTFVCRCEDVTFKHLQQATSFRAAKLHTRCGMGPCQARVCGPATEFLFRWKSESVRPPLFPARLETLIEHKTEEQETLS
ncbi:MAG TPA: FAD/NAD(P)-binding oxidoreductase [Bryobacteraceae bacterium]|nr:FAD/NAD(P)-binding oxidoreductase [Bryobacteraceae bacterium]